jgi:hypothetical protein
VDPNVLAQVYRVVNCNSLQALKIRCEFIELSEATTSLLFDVNFDLAYPPSLQLNALRNHFFFQAYLMRSVSIYRIFMMPLTVH